jgi:site-specific recombinase XerD
MTAEEYQKAAAVKAVQNHSLPAGRELSAGEIAALMAACEKDHTPAGIRDGAIIALLYACGLRRAELSTLTMEDYNQDTGRLVINGKGSKQRTAYLTNGALYAMADWLQIRGDVPGQLFLAINKSGRVLDHGITPQAVYNMLIKRAAAAGVTTFTPHDLRRTFVSDLLDAGADIATVSHMAGHASVNTTARYDRRPEAAKQKAAGLLHVPYRRRK